MSSIHLGSSWPIFRVTEASLQDNNCKNSEFVAFFLACKIPAELNSETVPIKNHEILWSWCLQRTQPLSLTFCIRAIE